MQKRLILTVFALLLSFSAFAQKDVTASFRSYSVKIKDMMLEETTVKTPLQIKNVTQHDTDLDFLFNECLWDYLWNEKSIQWFREEMKKRLPSGYASCNIRNIESDGKQIEDLAFEPAGNNGVPAKSNYRVTDLRKARKPLVSEVGGPWLSRGLSGRHIALWQSHGRYFEHAENRWEWQRAPMLQTVEDLYTQSFVLPFLIPMLENAGACVMTPRERDTQVREVICDNDPSYEEPRGELERTAGKYKEHGDWEDAGAGFADAQQTYTGYDNPFKMGTARKAKISRDGSRAARAVWTPKIPVRGSYAVYVSYKTLPESTDAAHYTVRHLGGETDFTVNQQYGGGTWIYLGTFEFGSGTDGAVILTGDVPEGVSAKGSVITADAVRFGGGMGKISRGIEGGELTTSGLPCYTEGALYSMQFSGIDMHLMDEWEREYTKEYAGRSVWVKNVHVPFDLSLAFHSDAGLTTDDTTVGTLAIYTYKDPSAKRDKETLYTNGEDRMNGRIYAGMVQDEIITAVREEFDSKWNRRQLWNRNYSETRSPGIPAMILEILSHQNFNDMQYGLDPAFRFTVSRAVYKGILKYLASRYGCSYTVQPLPVENFSVEIDSASRAVLSWKPVRDKLEPTAKPKGYLLQTRMDGGVFDKGVEVEFKTDGAYCTTTVPLRKGHIYSWRIVAFNDGGRSFPSETLCAGISSSSRAKNVLVVNNFTRVSAPAWFDGNTYAGFRNTLDSGVPYIQEINYIGSQYEIRRNLPWVDDDNPGFGASYIDEGGKSVAGNTFDYPYIHGQSILRAGYSFASASIGAANDRGIPDGYFAVDLICGKQVTSRVGRNEKPPRFSIWTEKLQTRLLEFTAGGGHILVSGSYIGTDAWSNIYELPTDMKYRSAAQAFIRETLGWKWMTTYGTHTGTASPLGNKTLNVNVSPSWITRPNPYRYSVENTDGIVPATDRAGTFLRYTDTQISAGVWFDTGSWKSVSLGFPIEAVESRTHRDVLLRSILRWFDQKE